MVWTQAQVMAFIIPVLLHEVHRPNYPNRPKTKKRFQLYDSGPLFCKAHSHNRITLNTTPLEED